MCGIAGFLNLDGAPADAAILRRMTAAIAHRGPDGEGHFVDGPLALGHRRLAILDLSPAGAQPMRDRADRLTISYNGEVYNFRELRRDLNSRGETFRSQSDTEVVLEALAAWDKSAIPKFNGMFALACWNRANRTLLLARDRYGIKPLYTCRVNRTLLFASEAKAFLAHPEFDADIDPAGVLEYFTFQNFLGSQTLLRGVRMLPAGSTMTINATTGGQQIDRYWDFHFAEPALAPSEQACEEELSALFEQAVQRQLVSDVEVGSYLSGGMDSGSLVAVASKTFPLLQTFTCGFDIRMSAAHEQHFDERAAARRMSSLFGTAHHESLVAPEDVGQVLPALAWHLEEPRVGQSYPNYRAAELAARRVKVVLGGTGGDELFGGYPWRYGHLEGATTFDAYLQALYTRWQRLLPAADRADVFAPMHAEIRGLDPFDLLETSFRDAPSLTAKLRPEEIANLSFTFEARTFLHGLLVVDDKLSMAHGLECRVPFLDNDLVDFAMRVPAAMKLRLADNASQGRTNGGKQILRKAMLRFLPAEIVNAQKQGFSAPDETWFRRECRSLIAGRLGDLQSPIYDYLDRPTVARLIDDHVSGRENRRLLIWSLLNFDAFCRAFLHADHSSTFDHPPAQELIHAA